MSKNLKRRILTEYGIETDDDESLRVRQSANNCPRCKFVNVFENMYCAQCSYPLSIAAYDEIKKEELAKIQEIESKYEDKVTAIRKEIEDLRAETKRHSDVIYPRKLGGARRAKTYALLARAFENTDMS